jgi:uncharacterized membrane protein
MAACAKCGATLAEGASFCGSCGTPVAAAGGAAPAAGSAPPSGTAAPAASSGGMASNVAGALAYVTIIPAIIFLVMEPFNKDRFVKFNAFQCLFLAAATFALYICLLILNVIPIVGTIIYILLMPLVGLAAFILAVISAIKAYNNQKFMIPFIGKLAEQQAEK